MTGSRSHPEWSESYGTSRALVSVPRAVSSGSLSYLDQPPIGSLRRYVESIWVQQDLDAAARRRYRPTKILPTGSLKLVLHYADPYVQLDGGGGSVEPLSYVSGQRTHAVDVAATGQTGVIIVQFYPWSAPAFLPVPADELEDAMLPLDSVLKKRTLHQLEGQIRAATTLSARAHAVQRFLRSLLDTSRLDPIADEAVRRIHATGGSVRIQRLAEALHLSRRQLTRRFTKSVGTTPKAFCRIVRVQKAMALRRRAWPWALIARELGYSDQSHLTKDFRSLTMSPPQRLAEMRPQSDLSRFFHAGRDMSHYYNTSYL